MFKRSLFNTAVALAAFLFMVSGMCFIPIPAVALNKSQLVNSELRDGDAGWDLGEFGTAEGKVTREGYPSVKLTVVKT